MFELIGARRDFSGLKLSRRTYESAESYLGQFSALEGDPLFQAEAREFTLVNLCLSRTKDSEEIKALFPHVAQWPTQLVMDKPGGGPIFHFGPQASVYIERCLLVNRMGIFIRAKHILHAAIWSKSIPLQEIVRELEKRLSQPLATSDDLQGIHWSVNQEDELLVLAGQFANVYLTRAFQENQIGDFLRDHPIILQCAFDALESRFQLRLKWIEGNPAPDECYIQPDVLLRRSSGDWDICDLKTAQLDSDSLTRGEHRRRRFKDYVHEGLAQLANYRQYFDFPANREWAELNHGIATKNPKGILIVGNFYNASRQELEEAGRAIVHGLQVIDYDTVRSMFIAKATAHPVPAGTTSNK